MQHTSPTDCIFYVFAGIIRPRMNTRKRLESPYISSAFAVYSSQKRKCTVLLYKTIAISSKEVHEKR